MNYNTRCHPVQRLNPAVGQWLGYKLRSCNLRQADIAERANKSQALVSAVLNGRRSSTHVYHALCTILGYASCAEMLADAQRNAV